MYSWQPFQAVPPSLMFDELASSSNKELVSSLVDSSLVCLRDEYEGSWAFRFEFGLRVGALFAVDENPIMNVHNNSRQKFCPDKGNPWLSIFDNHRSTFPPIESSPLASLKAVGRTGRKSSSKGC
jgi:hypothetical protein